MSATASYILRNKLKMLATFTLPVATGLGVQRNLHLNLNVLLNVSFQDVSWFHQHPCLQPDLKFEQGQRTFCGSILHCPLHKCGQAGVVEIYLREAIFSTILCLNLI